MVEVQFLNLYGAVLGSHVTDLMKNIVSKDLFTDNHGALMFGMLCTDLASALWLTFATYVKWPVSTTHSIGWGNIVSFSLYEVLIGIS